MSEPVITNRQIALLAAAINFASGNHYNSSEDILDRAGAYLKWLEQ